MTSPLQIKRYLSRRYPQLRKEFAAAPTLPCLLPSTLDVLDAVTRIIVGQMLSRQAATAILHKAAQRAVADNVPRIADLPAASLRDCGISGRKIVAIHTFATHYHAAPDTFEHWRQLPLAQLYQAVDAHWGLSAWTASMLGIFYFAHADVFPDRDGTIKRILAILAAREIHLDPLLATPYRSYLALYLWKFLDDGIVRQR